MWDIYKLLLLIFLVDILYILILKKKRNSGSVELIKFDFKWENS